METFILREARVVYRKYRRVKSLTFKSPATVYEHWFKRLKREANEKMVSVYLNSANEAIAFSSDEGDLDQCVVYPRKIVKAALLNNATRMIFVHNHPSNNVKPSEHDIEITKKLKEALATVDIEVLDHIIVGDGGYYSFREHGII